MTALARADLRVHLRRVPGFEVAAGRAGARSRMVVALREGEEAGTFVRLATAGAVGFAVLLPLVELGRIAVSRAAVEGAATPQLGDLIVPALLATAAFLPLHVQHVRRAVRGSRRVPAGWTLAVMAIIVVAATPVIGAGWLFMFASLALSVLIVVRPPWSFAGYLALAVATGPMALALGEPRWSALYFPITVAWRAATLFVLVWLVSAARQLQTARLALTDEAVLRERLRIEGELRATIGDALATIATGGRRAAVYASRDPTSARDELQTLVEGSRRTLADARRISSSYQRSTLRAELDTATALLGAAGIETRLELPVGDPLQIADEQARATLRSATAHLLTDAAARRCTITVTHEGERLRLGISSDGGDRETAPVTS